MLLHATMYTHIVSIYTTVDDDQDDTKTDDESDFGGGWNETLNVHETANGNGNENNPTFSIEDELCYKTRFKGYNIPDSKYEVWLRVNHPGVVSSNPSVSVLQTTPKSLSVSLSSLQQHIPSTS